VSEPHLEHEVVTDDGVVVGYPAAAPAGTDLRLESGARLKHGAVVRSPATVPGPVREPQGRRDAGRGGARLGWPLPAGNGQDRAAGVSSIPRAVPAAAARPQAAVKRAFDIVVAAVLLVLALPLLVMAGLLMLTTSRGGILFRQERLGRHRRPFVIYKFRTMVAGCSDEPHREYIGRLLAQDADAPTDGERRLYKLVDDPRVTRAGRLLRRTSLDELPQLWNVLVGDMSLVGPRPALPYEAEQFGPAHDRRYMVRPGITGLWQVSGRNRLTMRQGLRLDLEYVDRQSFLLDLKILIKTVPAVLSSNGS
jgi:lipopolysaccharide/colanic/teichoic acid biosynthesis glycosyltransferase